LLEDRAFDYAAKLNLPIENDDEEFLEQRY